MQTRIVVLGDAWDLLKFLNDDEYAIDPKAAAKELGADGTAVLDAALAALDGVADWTAADIEAALKAALIERSGAQTAQGFRPDPGGRHRNDGQPAVVRIAGAARPRAQPAAAAAARDRVEQSVRMRPDSLVVCTSADNGWQRRSRMR